jgi:hypothetical protein
MQIFIKASSGRTMPLRAVQGLDDIARVKALIQNSEGIPPDQQSLYSACGQLLHNEQTLNDCGIRAESQLQLRLVGEAPPRVGRPARCRYGVMAAVAAVALCVVVAVCTGSGRSAPQELRGHASGCDKNPCGEHGQCTPSDGGNHICACESGWKGDACAFPTGCDGQPCGTHGRCNATGANFRCECDSGFGGPECKHAAECYQRYINISDPWRSVKSSGGTHGDFSQSCNGYTKTGVGAGRLYRFIGPAGDGLPTSDPGKDHCGCASPGWLSGWGQPGNKDPPAKSCSRKDPGKDPGHKSGGSQKWSPDGKCPPINYKTPGSYPSAGQPLSNYTVCFNADHWSAGKSCGPSAPIGVARCEGFLLWRLLYTPNCCSCGYCTA